MSENNQMMSVQGQLVGLPLAGPESFSQQQLEYLKRALGVDETVLWDCNGTPIANTSATANLSEAASNFQYIRFYWMGEQSYSEAGLYGIKQSTFDMTVLNTTGFSIGGFAEFYSNNAISLAYGHLTLNEAKTVVTLARQARYNIKTSAFADFSTGNGMFKLYRIVGIHRIAGGNQ